VLAMFIMMDGSWDKGKRGLGILNLHTIFFTYTEVKRLQKILYDKYNVVSYLNFQNKKVHK
jgi:LAGLIDADG DNA endonuclease family